MKFTHKDILSLQELSKEDIENILECANSMREILEREIKKVPTLRGKTVANLFYEPSTRTRLSFELAAKHLSADVVNIQSSGSSIQKGESLKDTIKTLEAMGIDIIVLRHSHAGAAHIAARITKASLINAGDGAHEHPTQGLLDLFTIKEKKGTIEGLNVLIVGDIRNSRVARSDIWAFKKLGANVKLCAPAALLPQEFESVGVGLSYDLDSELSWADVIIVLRIQFERHQGLALSDIHEYRDRFCLTKERAARLNDTTLIMHPGPINRDIEIAGEVADSAASLITQQVRNGVAIRMAILYLLGTR